MIYKKYVKRLLDIILSGILIIVLTPVYLIIALIVRFQMGSPVLFSQERIGLDETVFKLYKFRSMTNERDEQGGVLPDNERLTRFGIALRSSSLDELPELFMIFIGKMSFVGPRPQPKESGPYFTNDERVAHTVRGGLIPPDSILLKVQCDWETQLECESQYAKNVTFLLDIKVILCTFAIIIMRIKNSYGADNRPELYEYRSNMEISQEVRERWQKKGVALK